MEKAIDFIKRRFVTADNTIVFDEQFEGYLTTVLNRMINITNNISPKMESWEKQLEPIILEYRGEGEDEEPLNGDAVDRLCEIIKAKINLHEGNITEDEYEKILG